MLVDSLPISAVLTKAQLANEQAMRDQTMKELARYGMRCGGRGLKLISHECLATIDHVLPHVQVNHVASDDQDRVVVDVYRLLTSSDVCPSYPHSDL